ncbi:TPA: hypothetical protein ACKP2J_001266, partial [Serratia marcescens]
MQKLIFSRVRNIAMESEGLGDSGIETFLDNPFVSLSREIGQNSRDVKASSSVGPVKVCFDIISVNKKEIPGINDFAKAVESCLVHAKDRKDKKGIEFFENIIEKLKSKEINLLKISDYNTKGLEGPCEEGTPFHSLVKSKGVSQKGDNEASGGSHGIGKNAVFAISEGRTVFYSTCYINKLGAKEFLFQGKSLLTSHLDEAGQAMGATCYWGQDGFKPISNVDFVPKWLRRDSIGTSIFALFVREHEDWENEIALSLVSNFTSAIYYGDIEFSINNGSVTITSDSLGDYIRKLRCNIISTGELNEDMVRNSEEIYSCLTDIKANEGEIKIDGLGKFSIKVLLDEKMPKRVNFIRNGMLITTNLKNFKDKLLNFNQYANFIAIVEPIEDSCSASMKKMENPRHDELSTARIISSSERIKLYTAMNKLGEAIRKFIKSRAYMEPKNKEQLDELAHFFGGDDSEMPVLDDSEGLENHPDTTKIIPAKRKSIYGDEVEGDGYLKN